jgi:hypothetical protein
LERKSHNRPAVRLRVIRSIDEDGLPPSKHFEPGYLTPPFGAGPSEFSLGPLEVETFRV